MHSPTMPTNVHVTDFILYITFITAFQWVQFSSHLQVNNYESKEKDIFFPQKIVLKQKGKRGQYTKWLSSFPAIPLNGLCNIEDSIIISENMLQFNFLMDKEKPHCTEIYNKSSIKNKFHSLNIFWNKDYSKQYSTYKRIYFYTADLIENILWFILTIRLFNMTYDSMPLS